MRGVWSLSPSPNAAENQTNAAYTVGVPVTTGPAPPLPKRDLPETQPPGGRAGARGELPSASLLGPQVAVRTKCTWGGGREQRGAVTGKGRAESEAWARPLSPGLQLLPCQKERLTPRNYSLVHPTHSLLVGLGSTEVRTQPRSCGAAGLREAETGPTRCRQGEPGCREARALGQPGYRLPAVCAHTGSAGCERHIYSDGHRLSGWPSRMWAKMEQQECHTCQWEASFENCSRHMGSAHALRPPGKSHARAQQRGGTAGHSPRLAQPRPRGLDRGRFTDSTAQR